MKTKARMIALYLPQYHPTHDNDIWWGRGFTEWTNVAKAKPLFRGHYQPKIPADLGFYDLRLPIIRNQQAELAKDAGIDGFCYYHYWFGNGKQEIELPFNEVVKSGEPDFPFCLCWANESWHSKFWSKDGTSKSKILVEQLYPGNDEHIRHFFSLLNAFKDKRYMKYKGKNIFMIYSALTFPNVSDFIRLWNKLAEENGLNGFHFIAYTFFPESISTLLSLGFSAVCVARLNNFALFTGNQFRDFFVHLYHKVIKTPYICDYKASIKKLIGEEFANPYVYPTVVPNWDHTPRSGYGGYLLHGSTPELFKQHLSQVLNSISMKDPEDKIVFLKSWNEWGEGNYVEPDLKYGHGYLEAIKDCL